VCADDASTTAQHCALRGGRKGRTSKNASVFHVISKGAIMSPIGLGNQLNRTINSARGVVFEQGETAELTYGAFNLAASQLRVDTRTEIEITYPIGWHPNGDIYQGKWTYKKDALLAKYTTLAESNLCVDGAIRLVAIMEALLGDIVRCVMMMYPQKLGKKRSVSMDAVLSASSIAEVQLRATDELLHELSYKSPTEFAQAVQPLLSINLLECPAFHKYMETKATRDVFVHNRGIANDIYLRKSGSHARVKANTRLPMDTRYFLESYEQCLQLIEWIEEQSHAVWHSSELESRRAEQRAQAENLDSSSGVIDKKKLLS
jgi:hypothetical protein